MPDFKFRAKFNCGFANRYSPYGSLWTRGLQPDQNKKAFRNNKFPLEEGGGIITGARGAVKTVTGRWAYDLRGYNWGAYNSGSLFTVVSI